MDTKRQKRGIFYDVFYIFNAITENLDASDVECFTNSINKSQMQIENLIKKQVSVT